MCCEQSLHKSGYEGIKLSCILDRGSLVMKLHRGEGALRLLKCVMLLLASKSIPIGLRIYKPIWIKAYIIPSDNLGLVLLKKINGI